MAGKPGVLMVVGAYYPELSGAGLQCRALVGRLRDEVDFTVLTTTADRSLPVVDTQEGVPVYRVFIDPSSWWSKTAGALRMTRAFTRTEQRFSIVHLHGFSQKTMLLVSLALARRKKIAIKLTSVGHDDPQSIRRRGMLAAWCYRQAAVYFAVSPRFQPSYDAAGLPRQRWRLIPNGVDLERFRPPAPGESAALRRQLSIPAGDPVVLFVGFFSAEKRPDQLFEAWLRISESSSRLPVLVFVGATRSSYYEIDRSLAEGIQQKAAAHGVSDRVHFVETALDIERFHRAADIFVLPSVREGLPNALLEAMASGAACVATRLEGVTDSLIEDGRNGLLVPPDDPSALERALRRLTDDPALGVRLGQEARRTIETRYGLDVVAHKYMDVYRGLVEPPECAA